MVEIIQVDKLNELPRKVKMYQFSSKFYTPEKAIKSIGGNIETAKVYEYSGPNDQYKMYFVIAPDRIK